MSHPNPDLQPTDEEALQAESLGGPEPVARVTIASAEVPIRTQGLPRKAGGTRTRTIGLTPTKLLAADHRRAIARVVSIGQNMLIALQSSNAQDASTMALWPQNVPYELTADTELWVASATGTTSVSVVTEYWATGD